MGAALAPLGMLLGILFGGLLNLAIHGHHAKPPVCQADEWYGTVRCETPKAHVDHDNAPQQDWPKEERETPS